MPSVSQIKDAGAALGHTIAEIHVHMLARAVALDSEAAVADYFRGKNVEVSSEYLTALWASYALAAGISPADPVAEPEVSEPSVPVSGVSLPGASMRTSAVTNQMPALPTVTEFTNDFEFSVERPGLVRIATVTGSAAATLVWGSAPSGTDDSVYLIVGHPSQHPTSPIDGVKLAAATGGQATVEHGRALFFTVFFYPNGPHARGVRHAIGQIVPEVLNLDIDAQPNRVSIGWTVPVGVGQVRIFRSLPNQPLGLEPDPTRMLHRDDPAAATFHDTAVEPGARYEYLVYSESIDLTGAVANSTGQRRVVSIPTVIGPVNGFKARLHRQNGHEAVTISWLPPEFGRVEIYQKSGDPDRIIKGRRGDLDQIMSLDPGRKVLDIPEDFGRGRVGFPSVVFPLAEGTKRTYSAIVVLGGQALISETAVLQAVGPVRQLELVERTDFQLLRVGWPEGAKFLDVWVVPQDNDVAGVPARRVARSEYEMYGGVMFSFSGQGGALPPNGCDVVVRGSSLYGGIETSGPVDRISYSGRWVMSYRLQHTNAVRNRMPGNNYTATLEVILDPGEQTKRSWPDMRIGIVTSPDRYPLTATEPGGTQLGVDVLRSGAIPTGIWSQVGGEFTIPRRDYYRLFAFAGADSPIIIDPIPRQAVAPVEPILKRHEPDVLYCPQCFARSDFIRQAFRCAGTCADVEDARASAFTRRQERGKPVFELANERHIPAQPAAQGQPARPAQTVTAGPRLSAPCPTCSVTTNQISCYYCHFDIPAQWWKRDDVSMILVGAKTSGKTSYLQVLTGYLERTLAPSLKATLHPANSYTEAKLAEVHEFLDNGILAKGSETNLTPQLFELGMGPSGRSRAISIFDVAGEDMNQYSTITPYEQGLSRSDVLVFLVDPLQIQQVRDFIEGSVALPPQGANPTTVINNVIAVSREHRKLSTGKLPVSIAVVLSKMDGLVEATQVPNTQLTGLIRPGSALTRDPQTISSTLYNADDGIQLDVEVRSLLHRLGAEGFMHTLEQNYHDVKYFSVSALGHDTFEQQIDSAGISSLRVGDPFRWIASRYWA
jgi:hypothetical protein